MVVVAIEVVMVEAEATTAATIVLTEAMVEGDEDLPQMETDGETEEVVGDIVVEAEEVAVVEGAGGDKYHCVFKTFILPTASKSLFQFYCDKCGDGLEIK